MRCRDSTYWAPVLAGMDKPSFGLAEDDEAKFNSDQR
jgi:hypothetical protein